MGIKQETLQEICDLAARQVQELYPNLQMMFIPHANGMFHEIVETSEHQVLRHPAGRIAQTILEKNNNREQSSFLGIAIQNQAKWLGLVSKDHMLALFNINTDEMTSISHARQIVYHLAWHAIDLAEVRKRPEYSSKFRSGPMVPKRSPMNLARLNLQADVFASVMASLYGDDEAITSLAKTRALDSLSNVYERRAEDYPFCIAMEATQYAYQELVALKPAKSKFMIYARQMAIEIGNTYNDTNIRHWWGFSEPAQDMIWRDFKKEIVLGCAMYTSEDPYIRAVGHLIHDITGIEPVNGLTLEQDYNAFANPEASQVLHRELIEKALEDAIAIGVREESGQPLLLAANAQNENLVEGRIIGWCAHALQAAGRAFENALSNGSSPDVAARLEFAGTKDNPNWDTLKKIGEKIVGQKRTGFGVTLGNIAEIANANPAFASVLGSIKITMNDPSYVRKLEAANDLMLGGPAPAMAGPAPKGPAPAAPSAGPKVQATPQQPVYSAGPAGPSLGGGSNAAALNRARMEQLRQQTQSAANDEDKTQ